MQPVNDNRVQHQIIPVQQKITGHRETSSSPTKISPSSNGFILPEDVVNLSADRSSITDSSVKKKPSVPVTSGERKALRDSFSIYA
jgi:hypothetical protein